MNIVGFSEKALREYGPLGDRTLEYIGADILPDKAAELRVYRKGLSFADDPSPFSGIVSAYGTLLRHKDVKICDVSQSGKGYRMTFLLPEMVPMETLTPLLDDFFTVFPSEGYEDRLRRSLAGFMAASKTELSPLMQVGVEVGADLSPISLKYYMRLPKALSKPGTELDRLSEIYNASASSSELSGKDLNDEHRALTGYNYLPIFIGYNDREGERELKLYYKSASTGYRPNELRLRAAELSKKLGWTELLSESDIDSLYRALRLYIEGVAASLTHDGRWRIYINRLPN